MKRLLYIVFLILLFLPPVMIIFFIYNYAMYVPVCDSLTLVPLLQKMHSGNLTISDVWTVRVPESRAFFPVSIMLLLAKLTNWNMWFELYTNWILVGLVLLFTYLILRKTLSISYPSLSRYLMIVFSFIIFSPAQWGSWLWSWYMLVFLSITATIGAIWTVTQWEGQLKGILLAICFCFVATFSFGSGILSWVLVIFLLLSKTPRNWKQIALILLAFMLTLILHYSNYPTSPGHPLTNPLSKNFFRFILFCLAFIGAPIGIGKMIPCIISGCILVLIFIVGTVRIFRTDRKLFRQFLPWFTLACYSIVSAGGVAFARIEGFGLKQALASRYIIISMWLTIAVVIIVAIWLKQYFRNIKTSVRYIGLATVIILLLISGIVVIPYGKNVLNMLADRRENVIECWENIESAPDEWLRCLNDFNPASVREPAKILKELGLIRVKPLPTFDCFRIVSGNNDSGAIETLYSERSQTNQTNLFKQDDKIVVKGWVRIPAKYVIIVSRNKVLARAELKENKQDWKKRFNSLTLPKGISEIRAYAVLNNEKDISLLKNSFITDVK